MLLVYFFAALAFICQKAEAGQVFNYDGVQWEAVGCYRDESDRALEHHFKTVENLNKDELKKTSFRPYFEACAVEAKKHNYFSFGIQNVVECWGDKDLNSKYDMYGVATNCEKSDNEKDLFQIGKAFSNFIYRAKPINGGFTPFGPYSKCTKSCGGGGTQKRTRSCTNPKPMFGGKDCKGPLEQTRACGQKPCPAQVKPIIAMLTGDNKAEVYVDGKLMTPENKGNWKVAKKYILPGDFKVLAAYITSNTGRIGFKGSFSNGIVTKSGAKGGWKCVDKKPSGNWKLLSYKKDWKAAKAYKGRKIKGIDNKAKFIYGSKKKGKKVWCRRVFRKA